MRLFLATLALVLTFTVSACEDIEWGCPEGTHAVTTTEYTYHYGFNPASGKYEFFWGPETTTECVAD